MKALRKNLVALIATATGFWLIGTASAWGGGRSCGQMSGGSYVCVE